MIAGTGETRQDDARIAWRAGDVFCLPGGRQAVHAAGDQDCVLWIATDEPIYAQTHAAAPPADDASVVAVHYRTDEIFKPASPPSRTSSAISTTPAWR